MRIVSSTRVGDCKAVVAIDNGVYKTWNEINGVAGKAHSGTKEQTFHDYDCNVEVLKMQRDDML
jgi:hypothetical protein